MSKFVIQECLIHRTLCDLIICHISHTTSWSPPIRKMLPVNEVVYLGHKETCPTLAISNAWFFLFMYFVQSFVWLLSEPFLCDIREVV